MPRMASLSVAVPNAILATEACLAERRTSRRGLTMVRVRPVHSVERSAHRCRSSLARLPRTTTSCSTAAARSSSRRPRSSSCRPRPPKTTTSPARPAEQLHRLLLDEAGLPQQGQHGGSARRHASDDAWENFFAFNGTKLEQFPLPAGRPLALARQLDGTGRVAVRAFARTRCCGPAAAEANREILAERRWQWEAIRRQMIALQEELDWECYRLYGLTEEDLTQRREARRQKEIRALCLCAFA